MSSTYVCDNCENEIKRGDKVTFLLPDNPLRGADICKHCFTHYLEPVIKKISEKNIQKDDD